tara:strand:- start:2834 stop:3685 length:852 start_codon:yes stop_codon:yes gene_type:complete
MRHLLILLCLGVAGPVLAQDAPRLGIFGLVDATDPLIVAGQTFLVPEGAPVISPLGPDAVLELGDTVAIVATMEDSHLVATRLMQVFPVAGPLSDVTETTASVMGTVVHIPPGVLARPGQWVAVSGLWSGETVITSRLRQIDWDGFGQLAGVVEVSDETVADRIGGTKITGIQAPEGGFGGSFWTLTGSPEGAGLRIRLMSKGVFGGKVDLVLWQGYASLPVASQTYMIHGSGITGTATDPLMPDAGSLVRRCAAQGRVVKSAPEGLDTAFELLGCATYNRAD